MSMWQELEIAGFTSERNAHTHLLKHVLRVAAQEGDRLQATTDPERWEKLVGEPLVTANLQERRKGAIERLRAVEGCAASELKKPTRERICEGCQNHQAQLVVTGEMNHLLLAYIGVAREALATCAESPQLTLAYRSDQGPTVDITDSRKVRVIAALDSDLHRARLVSCYRSSDNLKRLARWYGRYRASYRRTGRLLEGE